MIERNENTALVISHPGHELCVYGWLETVRPRVFVLTDGSGRTGASRLNSTTKIISAVGASPASIYGRYTDRDVYTAILRGDFGLFERLVLELSEILVGEGFDCVAGDAMEGYNPVHDTCRLVVDAAVEIARRRSGRRIINRDFLLFGRHDTHPEELRENSVWLTLDDDLFARKISLARTYPELRNEIEAALDKMGSDAYRVECLRLVPSPAKGERIGDTVPFYERYGELLVASGVYQQAIRYREHIVPLMQAIWRIVDADHSYGS